MSVLSEIVSNKVLEVEERKALYPIKLLEKRVHFLQQPVSLSKYLTKAGKSGIIAEIKRKSPSRGPMHSKISIERVSIGYMQAGASALSILTDNRFFGGSNEDLMTARKFNYCPILRKDFILDEYQVIEAKSMGADAILLIAAILEKSRVSALSKLAHDLGMEVLVEFHEEVELSSEAIDSADILGVNNRDLKTFETSYEKSLTFAGQLPKDKLKISESGLHDPAAILQLAAQGYNGFLIGEAFMRHHQPHLACAEFIRKLTTLTKSSDSLQ